MNPSIGKHGTQHELKILYGHDVRDWWLVLDPGQETGGAELAWTGMNPSTGKPAPRSEKVRLTGSKTWKTVCFTLPRARFRAAQNYESDFRFELDPPPAEFFVHRVSLIGCGGFVPPDKPP